MKCKKFTELQIRKALTETFKQMDDKMFNTAVEEGLNMSQESWNSCSFSFEDIADMTIENLINN